MTLEHLSQAPESIELDLAHTLSCNSNLITDLFQRCAVITVQTESPLHNFALFRIEFVHPAVDDVIDVRLLRTP